MEEVQDKILQKGFICQLKILPKVLGGALKKIPLLLEGLLQARIIDIRILACNPNKVLPCPPNPIFSTQSWWHVFHSCL